VAVLHATHIQSHCVAHPPHHSVTCSRGSHLPRRRAHLRYAAALLPPLFSMANQEMAMVLVS
jgi:hypothetical protein